MLAPALTSSIVSDFLPCPGPTRPWTLVTLSRCINSVLIVQLEEHSTIAERRGFTILQRWNLGSLLRCAINIINNKLMNYNPPMIPMILVILMIKLTLVTRSIHPVPVCSRVLII